MNHAGPQPIGLRERKKAQTRAAIQDHALRLYLEHGYHATTIRQITAAAEVSESTFLRYFPTKIDTVIYDRWDPILLESLVQQPAELSPSAAVRAALHEVLSSLGTDQSELEQMRWRLVASVPELRSALTARTGEAANELCQAIATRLGARPGDFAIRTWVGALLGVTFAAITAALDDPQGDVLSYLDAALDRLDAGVPLPPRIQT